MMKSEVKIGLFLGIVIVILAGLILIVGDLSHLFREKGYPLLTVFDSVAGLERRTIVRLAGVKVGEVEDIRLKDTQAEVLMLIDPEVKVRVDSRATQAALGLLGEKYIEIVPGSRKEYCKPGDTIAGESTITFDQIGSKIVGIGEDIRGVGDALKNVISGEENAASLEHTLGNISSMVGEMEAFIRDNKSGISQTVKGTSGIIQSVEEKLQEVTTSLSELIDKLKTTVDENRGDIRGNLEKLNDLFLSVEKSLKILTETLEKINKGEGSLGKLVQDSDLYQQTKDTVGSVQKMIEPLSSFKVHAALRAQYYGKSDVLKNILSLSFWPSQKQFFLGQLIQDPWQDKFTFSAQGGMRWGALTARAGVMESSFGVGVDYFLMKDRLQVSLESYDFNRRPRPRFRLWTSYSPSRHFYFLAGIDDFALSPSREIFFGFGVGLAP